MAVSNNLDSTYLAFLFFMGDYLMNTLKFLKKPLLEKRRHIISEWDNSQESSDNFHKAIKELRKQNIPYTVEWRRNITEIGKLIYFCYSIVLDLFLLLGIIWAVMNFERFL